MSQQCSCNQSLDEALIAGLSKEEILRVKAVDQTVAFFMDKQVSDVEVLHKTYEKIYNFLKSEDNG